MECAEEKESKRKEFSGLNSKSPKRLMCRQGEGPVESVLVLRPLLVLPTELCNVLEIRKEITR